MAKKDLAIVGYVKLLIEPGKANPAPPVGPALGQKGVNIKAFCDAFNSSTQDLDKSLRVPVIVTVYEDRSFTYEVKTPPVSALILKKISKKKGSSVPNRDKVGTLTREQVKDIAKIKMVDLTAADINAAMKCVEGTARSMGVNVEHAEGSK